MKKAMNFRTLALSSLVAACSLAFVGCTTTRPQDQASSASSRASIDAQVDASLSKLYDSVKGSRDLVAKEDVAKIEAPTLIGVGTKDDIAGSPHELAALMPHAEALDIPNRDHMLAVGDKVFKQAVLDFYERLANR